jgi:putative protease
MAVHKLRSSELKARVEALSQAPKDTRVRREHEFKVSVSLSALNTELAECYLDATILGEAIQIKSQLPYAKVQKPEAFAAGLIKDFSILGPNTQDCDDSFYLCSNVVLKNPDALFIPSTQVKALKQELRRALSQCLQSFPDKRSGAVTELSRAAGDHSQGSRLQIKFDRVDYLEGLAAYFKGLSSEQMQCFNELCFEPKRDQALSQDFASVLDRLFTFASEYKLGLRCAVPMVVRAWDEPLLTRFVQAFVERGGNAFELGNVGAAEFLRTCGVNLESAELSSDFSFYALNRYAVAQLADQGVTNVALSIEDDRSNVLSLLQHWPSAKAKPQAIIYKDTPLFIAEACSLTALHNGCPTASVCGYRTLEIENRKGERFYVAHEGCKSIVYAKEAYGIAQFREQLSAAGVSDFRIDFLTRPYSNDAIHKVLDSVLNAKRINETHSANFERELL